MWSHVPHAFWPLVCLLWGSVYSDISPVFTLVCLFSCYWVRKVRYTWGKSAPCQITRFGNVVPISQIAFSPCWWFPSLCWSFEVACSPTCLFLLFLPVLWVLIPQDHHQDPCPAAFSSVFSFRNLQCGVLYLIFSPLWVDFHVWRNRGSTVILLHVGLQFSQRHLSECPFPCCVLLASSTRSVDWLCLGFISGFCSVPLVCVCLSASTVLIYLLLPGTVFGNEELWYPQLCSSSRWPWPFWVLCCSRCSLGLFFYYWEMPLGFWQA